ncbi:MAG: nucleoside deaminase [Alphaproteobacteria bacterium]|nr:nucleoside deaminase [Alphaproteobacteria bacterium]
MKIRNQKSEIRNNFMSAAMRQAIKAQSHGDVPVGAIIVKDDKIIACGENRVQKNKDITAHAEIVAIRAAAKKMGTKFLDGCDIYITLEPCPMCITAISYARINRVIFAATDAKGGAITGGARVLEDAKNLWKPAVAQDAEYADESAMLLKDFFKKRRMVKE